MSGYELHQKLRTKTVRQVKKKQYDEAISTLYQGAIDLLDQKEQGSACDLALYMIDVYGFKSQQVDSESRDRITEILGKAQPDFWRKKVIDAALKWSAKASDAPAGDPLLRLYIAKMLAKESAYHLAEPHFISACIPAPTTYTIESAPKAFAQMMLDWLVEHSKAATEVEGETRDTNAIERIEAGRFALRGVMPFLTGYIELTTTRQKSLLLPVQPNPRPYVPPGSSGSAAKSDLQLYLTANADLNFAQMALALCIEGDRIKSTGSGSRAAPDWLKSAWTALVRQYEREAAALQQEEGVRETIPHLSAIYFDIQPPRAQSNMLSDMMASLFGGGGPAAGGASAARATQPAATSIKQAPPPSKPAQTAAPASTSAPSAQADDLVDDEMD
ncbi:related to GET4 - protein with a role in insertion of tail-anchored proteins into the ER membrane [Pseudozyma flocculosa]|uniref:Related to GET4 - protein with a role in insertion of tail-anchored proteins into the ER membrane n=1 Tax=Pseudozyma flocculosa TaxID=84751 RepID=A0A5C3F1Y4_9BASI|nr:related to GET4 - protein with a role in insertion of tail-anchored proteins into the ER membrane [Pseudozyma flocculosa]